MTSALISIVLIYLVAGIAFALLFVFRLVDRFDEQAHGASFGFRLLLLPASILLWPYLLRRYIKKARP